eukprot:jgi/Picsp_1/731/NSC_04220-R1_---NA---
MVWKGSIELGCARVQRLDDENSPFNEVGEGLYLVCRCSPPGNVKPVGDDAFSFFKENVLKPVDQDVVLPPPKPEPIPEPKTQQQQGDGRIKTSLSHGTVKLKIYGSGESCTNDAGGAAAQAVS